MKKLMTSTIIVLPLILLAILLVSGAIMSFSVHIYVETIELTNKDTIVLVMDDENNAPNYNLGEEITILPIKATNKKLNYTSEDENIVTIDKDGIIHANFYGETYVTVTSKENLTASATRKVVVTDDKVHAVRINEQCSDLYQNEKISLTASIYPKEAENKGIKWTSSNPAILDVSANGIVTALGAGKAKVIATSVENKNIYTELEITCHAKITDLKMDESKEVVQTSSNTVFFPSISALPNDINQDDITYTYSSSNQDIATVDDNGKIVFKTPGKVTITVTATDFGGGQVTAHKTFVSTCGYFAKPIFIENLVQWSNCQPGAELPNDWFYLLEGFDFNDVDANKAIVSISCNADGITPKPDMITFDKNKHKFVFGNDIECVNFIDVVVVSNAYDFNSDTLVTNTENLLISKIESEVGKDAKLTMAGQELTKEEGSTNEIIFNDIGEQIELTLTGTEARPIISQNSYVTNEIEDNIIILRSSEVCSEQPMVIQIGKSKFNLSVTVHSNADQLKLTNNQTEIVTGEIYNTLLDNLAFKVVPSRLDGRAVTDQAIQYKLNSENDWRNVEDGIISLNVQTENLIDIKCGNATFNFSVNKVELDDFGIKLNVSNKTIDTIDSVKETSEYQFRVPSDVLDQITLEIVTKTDLLGGFGDDDTFKEMFNVNLDGLDGWDISYSALNKQITLLFSAKQEFINKIKIGYKNISTTLQFVRINLTSIDFEGLDIGNKKDDVYLGIQQVRVFAKHSYYGGVVDYFKMPFQAISSLIGKQAANPEVISWNLTQVVGNDKQVITSQLGYNLTYNDTTYTITQDEDGYVLKDQEGNVVVGKDGKNPSGIIWVDVFSEPGYARIYFGKFAGLSESDVQNSYFGNFADDENWAQPKLVEKDDTDRIFDPSKNAYSFLQVEAGDGAVGGINRHYNFNVLDDDELVNVFDADGYYNNDKIVLHTNLYGPGEIDNPEANKVLTSPDKVSKTTVYGNGYHINLQARNQQLIDEAYSQGDYEINRLGWHNGASFEHIYNLTLMGANPATEIIRTKQSMVFRIGYAYYCDIQYLSKINTFYDDSIPDTGNGGNNRDEKGSYSYIKNSVIRYAAWACFQFSFPKDIAYFENVVFAESNIAITFENKRNMTCNFKGFNDILSYRTAPELCKAIGQQEGIGAEVIQYGDEFAEWFGKTNSGLEDILVAVKERYVNAAVANCIAFDYTNQVLFWNGNNYVAQNGAFADKITILELYRIWLYDRTVEFDGGLKVNGYYTDRDMSKLFDNPDDIRLLCQYKTPDEKNTDHIMWHIQQVYRDPNLIVGREQNHIEHLKSTLAGVTWPDGSSADEAIALNNQNFANNKLYIILPNKKQQLF